MEAMLLLQFQMAWYCLAAGVFGDVPAAKITNQPSGISGNYETTHYNIDALPGAGWCRDEPDRIA